MLSFFIVEKKEYENSGIKKEWELYGRHSMAKRASGMPSDKPEE